LEPGEFNIHSNPVWLSDTWSICQLFHLTFFIEIRRSRFSWACQKRTLGGC
jgi:hypothetical protein